MARKYFKKICQYFEYNGVEQIQNHEDCSIIDFKDTQADSDSDFILKIISEYSINGTNNIVISNDSEFVPLQKSPKILSAELKTITRKNSRPHSAIGNTIDSLSDTQYIISHKEVSSIQDNKHPTSSVNNHVLNEINPYKYSKSLNNLQTKLPSSKLSKNTSFSLNNKYSLLESAKSDIISISTDEINFLLNNSAFNFNSVVT